MSSHTPLPPTTGAHRDAAYRFAVGALYFAVISGVGSLIALLFGPFGIVVSVLVSLVGVYFGGIEVARGIDVVVRHAVSEVESDSNDVENGTGTDESERDRDTGRSGGERR